VGVAEPVTTAGGTGSRGGTAHLPLPMPTGERQVGARLYEYAIDLTRDTVPAGEIEFHVVNAGTTAHLLMVRSDEVFSATPHLEPGDTAVLRVTLPPGEHTVICIVRDEYDHPSEGMVRRIIAQ
jgi:hypothetical protein